MNATGMRYKNLSTDDHDLCDACFKMFCEFSSIAPLREFDRHFNCRPTDMFAEMKTSRGVYFSRDRAVCEDAEVRWSHRSGRQMDDEPERESHRGGNASGNTNDAHNANTETVAQPAKDRKTSMIPPSHTPFSWNSLATTCPQAHTSFSWSLSAPAPSHACSLGDHATLNKGEAKPGNVPPSHTAFSWNAASAIGVGHTQFSWGE